MKQKHVLQLWLAFALGTALLLGIVSVPVVADDPIPTCPPECPKPKPPKCPGCY